MLDLDASASKSQIKRSYRTLTAKWFEFFFFINCFFFKKKTLLLSLICRHPDKNRDDPDTAEKMFIEVAKAYKTLTDEVAREVKIKINDFFVVFFFFFSFVCFSFYACCKNKQKKFKIEFICCLFVRIG